MTSVWDRVAKASEPLFAWVRRPQPGPVCILLSAFDPPTLAHVALVREVARLQNRQPALCLTTTLLDRPDDGLVDLSVRPRLVEQVAEAEGFGFGVANRGTYVDVAAAALAAGIDAAFVIGSDKLAQLRDPSFYPDGERGVERTFREVRLLVVERTGFAADVPAGAIAVPADAALPNPEHRRISATQVRRAVREGLPIASLVPGVVVAALSGYTEGHSP